MADWLVALQQRVLRDGRAVLVTIAHATGSTPREAGTSMVVTARDAAGTIGGGHLEFEALRIARDALAHDRSLGAWVVRFPLAARLGQCCGGVATIAFNVIRREDGAWLDAAIACAQKGRPMALLTRIGADSTPLLVTAGEVAPGAGTAEDSAAVIAAARERLAARAGGALLLPPANPGDAALLLQVLLPEDFTVLLFGNGHVGRALAAILGTLPLVLRWIDSREVDFPTAVAPNIEIVISDDPVGELARAPVGASIFVTTHSHTLDLELIESALRREDWLYLGLIGSTSKRNQFEKRLAARGATPAALRRIVCPIGAQPGIAIRSKHPGAIAVAAVAELLALREATAAKAEGVDAPIRHVTSSASEAVRPSSRGDRDR